MADETTGRSQFDGVSNGLLVLYVPTLDRRWLSAEVTPFVSAKLEKHPPITLETHPGVELMPSLVTGVWPHEHRQWQVQLRDDGARRSLVERVTDLVPKTVITGLQCVRHRFDQAFDLPTVEPRRRRRFVMHRLKVQRRDGGGIEGVDLNGLPTVFSAAGESARYRTVFSFDHVPDGVASMIDGAARLEMLELYALDLFAHWNLDRPDAMRELLRRVDTEIAAACEKADTLGFAMVLVVDHGQERVEHHIDLPKLLDSLGVPRDDYCYYLEVCNARLWYANDAARQTIEAALRDLPRTTYVPNDEMPRYHIHFDADERFGDGYLFTDDDTAFFPHDFYHPLVNAYMARKTAEQLARRVSPVHRGYHGHLPGPPTNEAYLAPLSDGWRASAQSGLLIDAAPTMLAMLGIEPPATMTGASLLEPALETA